MSIHDRYADPHRVADALKRPKACDNCPYAAREPAKVFVHIWDDNANVYADRESALNGIGEGIDDEFINGLDDALAAAEHAGGDGICLDGGISTFRYLTITKGRA